MVKELINQFGENTYIINEQKEVFIVDPGAHINELEEYIKSNEYVVKGILLTHGHFDHIYSLNACVKLYDVPVYIHKLERDFLFDPNLNLSSSTPNPFKFEYKNNVEIIDENSAISLGRETIKVYHTPGHTRGSVCYHYKRFLLSGDTLFKDTIGRYDLPTSNKADLFRSLTKIIKHCKDNTVVYPGHGHFTTILNEKLTNPFMKNL